MSDREALIEALARIEVMSDAGGDFGGPFHTEDAYAVDMYVRYVEPCHSDPPDWDRDRDPLTEPQPITEAQVEAALDALDRQFGTITMTEVGHLVGSTSRFVRAALEAAQAVSGPQERYTCPPPGCGGDGRYPAPGRGHLAECRYPMDLAHESTDGES